jgi:hypothetical protein
MKMKYRIDRIIDTHKTVIIGFVTALLIILLAKNIMYLPGICPQQPSIHIIDESKQSSHIIQRYVDAISQHFSTKMNQLGKCYYAELFFVYRPLVSAGVEPFSLELTKYDDTKSLDSPWVKLTLTNSYKPIARAVFFWNERQFLLDQALMSGESTDFTKPLLPIDIDILRNFKKDYESSLDVVYSTPINSRQEQYNAAISNLSLRLPVDILWKFRNHGGGFSSIVNDLINRLVSEYIDITETLLDRRFASIETEQRYQSILDLKDIFNINEYKIK